MQLISPSRSCNALPDSKCLIAKVIISKALSPMVSGQFSNSGL